MENNRKGMKKREIQVCLRVHVSAIQQAALPPGSPWMQIPRLPHSWAKPGLDGPGFQLWAQSQLEGLSYRSQHVQPYSSPAPRSEKVQPCLQPCSLCPREARKPTSAFFTSASPSPGLPLCTYGFCFPKPQQSTGNYPLQTHLYVSTQGWLHWIYQLSASR